MTFEWLAVGLSFLATVLLTWHFLLTEKNNFWLIIFMSLTIGVLWLPKAFSVNSFVLLFFMLSALFYSQPGRSSRGLYASIFGVVLGLLYTKLINETWLWALLCLLSFGALVLLLIQGRTQILMPWIFGLLITALLLLMPERLDHFFLACLIMSLQLYFLLQVTALPVNAQSPQPLNVADIQATERSRIYQNIHDDVGAELLRLIYLLEDSEQKKQVKDIMHKLRRAVAQTTQVSTDLHQLSRDMIESCHRRLGEANIEFQSDLTIGYNYVFSNTHPAGLLRILNELLSNIIKHAEAHKVNLILTSDRQKLTVQLLDNGCGLPSNSLALHQGRGIRGLKKRALEMGATIVWRNQPDNGLLTTVSYPWP